MPTVAPIVVSGMHRSGTSMVASLLRAMGVHMGDHLIPADHRNKMGFFEDSDFVDLHKRILEAATSEADGGIRDWGWTESERLDDFKFGRFRAQALGLAEARATAPGLWGWKDPRTTLLLDFWAKTLSDARFVLVYRYPWEVSSSLERLGEDYFVQRPDYAYRSWQFYNRRLLDFHQRHPNRALLVSANTLLVKPEALRSLLAKRFGLALADADLDAISVPDIFHTVPPGDPIAGLVAEAYPDCLELYGQIDRAAELPGPAVWENAASQPTLLRPEQSARSGSPPRISVVLACRNDGELVLETVASVERSGLDRAELIVVNDGSSEPRSLAALEALRRRGYCVLDQPPQGLESARQRGIAVARGESLLLLKPGSRVRHPYLGKATSELEAEPQLAAVYGGVRVIGRPDRRIDASPLDADCQAAVTALEDSAVFRKRLWQEDFEPGREHPSANGFWTRAIARGLELRALPMVAVDKHAHDRRDGLEQQLTRLVQELDEREADHDRQLVELDTAHRRDNAAYEAEIAALSQVLKESDAKVYQQRDQIEELLAERDRVQRTHREDTERYEVEIRKISHVLNASDAKVYQQRERVEGLMTQLERAHSAFRDDKAKYEAEIAKISQLLKRSDAKVYRQQDRIEALRVQLEQTETTHREDKAKYETEIHKIQQVLEESDAKVYWLQEQLQGLEAVRTTARQAGERLAVVESTLRETQKDKDWLWEQWQEAKEDLEALSGSMVGRPLWWTWQAYLSLRRALIRFRAAARRGQGR